MARLDLHLHTTYSDGSYPPDHVVALASQAGVTTMAITDHDTVDGLAEAIQAGRQRGIEVIPGIELSSQTAGIETHILGYFFDWNQPELKQHLLNQRQTRHSRNYHILETLKTLGLAVTYEEVKARAGSDSIGRPHIAKVLLEKGYVSCLKDAFDRYLGAGKPAYVPIDCPSTAEAIAWIREAGGIPVLAHPIWVKRYTQNIRKLCQELKDQGLQGIEVFHSSHQPKDMHICLEVARQVGLLATGGSDFHGHATPTVQVGKGRGNLKVPLALLEPLKKAAGV
ncbi:MAG: PHP domain-containing protein [Nitrospirales bacterium]|nr:PHP domain-containing protein [Nitrospirales bacterium]